MAAEYIAQRGNLDIVLCERGIRTFEPSTRNTLDITAVPVVQAKSHLPVIVDPSHAGGRQRPRGAPVPGRDRGGRRRHHRRRPPRPRGGALRRSAGTARPRAQSARPGGAPVPRAGGATDPDREGEAISWHVLEVLKEKKALKDHQIERVVFNAITKQAVHEAMKHPRKIDAALVDAYLARRALDYLVGFTLSPVLWRKLPGARSAGRVQSVALRLVCDRELEIEKFVAQRILVDRGDARDPAQRDLRGAPHRRRRPEDPAARRRLGRRGRSLHPRSGKRDLPRRQCRGQARAAAIRRRPLPPRPCSRRPRASSASRRRTPCGWRSGSTRASTSAARPSASSPICAPTASTWRRRRSPPSAA